MLRSATTQLVLAVVALVLGFAAWTGAAREARIAAAMQSLVTFGGDAAGQLEAIPTAGRVEGWVPGASTSPSDVARARAAAHYWGGAAAVQPTDDALLAANAAYRAAVEKGGDASTLVARLDGVVKQYAEILRSDPSSVDAAFNYEFVVRYRAAIAARRQAVSPSEPDEALTMHGRAGAPPKGSDTRSFKMIVPMRPDERRQAEEAGRSSKRARKG